MDIGEICKQVAGQPKDIHHALDQLAAVRLGLTYWGRRRQEIVTYLREHKVPWQVIGDVMGVSPSAVYQRFKRESPLLDHSDS